MNYIVERFGMMNGCGYGARRLIADGGSSKVHWVIAEGGRIADEFFCGGVNPAVMPDGEVNRTISETLTGKDLSGLESVAFYGAGCKGEAACGVVRDALRCFVGDVPVSVESDMLGVCRALLGDGAGVACILGTGANSCVYDGRRIVANVSPGGYILGDEGSGAWLGKNLAGDLIRGMLPDDVEARFYERYGLDAAALVGKVYRPGAEDLPPNRFLASFAPFVSENIAVPEIRRIVERGFREFFRRNVGLYFRPGNDICAGESMRRIHFVGSVALAFGDVLRQVAVEEGFEVARIMKSPMEGLVSRLI